MADRAFGFEVRTDVWSGEAYQFYGGPLVQPGDRSYTVELPHQCTEWVVTDKFDHAEAVAEMKAFVAEASEALRQLEALGG